jgi:16S rRNA (cytosine967-C5)-methyltransferase
MTPAARIKASLELLAHVLIAPVPMDNVAGDYFRHRGYVGSKDRAAIADRLYRIMRAFGRLTWWCTKLDVTPDARHFMLLHLRLADNMSADDIITLFDGSRYGPDALVEDERKMLADLGGQSFEPDDMPEAVRVECPPEHEEKLRERFGANFAAEMTAMMTGAPLDLRVNLAKLTLEQAQKSLAKDGVGSDALPYCPWGMRLREKTFLSNTKAFREGFVEIQDEGSQLIAYITNAAPGMQVLDYCAGGGGKTLALAGMMKVKGRIVAMDTEARRLEKARPRFRRAGVHDIIEVRPLDDEQHKRWLRRQKGTFDVTLIDAPCSGSGTWRRNPDGRWRQFGPALPELLMTQAEILEKVAGTVKPDGRLVYATCSIFKSENEDQIDAFLKNHPEYKVVPVPDIWPDTTPCPVTGPYLTLSTARHNTDGFFAAVLQRVA